MIKDIMLTSNGDGTYDWTFNDRDLEICWANRRLISAVKHAVLLHYQELEYEPYTDKGCTVYRYIGSAGTPNTNGLIEESIIAAARSVEGVIDASVELEIGNANTVQIASLTVTNNSGEEVVIL